MTISPFAGLVRSRKFWLAVSDTVFSTALYFVGKYAGASVEDLRFIIAIYQPVVGLVIVGITVEDSVRVHSNAVVEVAQVTAMVDSAAPQNEQQLPPGQARDWPPRMPDRPVQPRR